MKTILTCLVVSLCFSTSLSAKKMVLPLELVALQADYIVVGEISEVHANSYEFKVKEQIKGASKSSIRVQQFKEWTCDTRFAKAEKGQKLVLFLKKENGLLEIINGSTGEIPIVEDKIKLLYGEYTDPKTKNHTVSLHDFKLTLGNFLKSYTAKLEGMYDFPDSLTQKVSDVDISTYRESNSFSTWLFDRVKSNYVIVTEN